nr:cytosolic endo-beta-N-acetylglucosaminidase 1 isoform X2 [Onthophagus taurus]
MHFLMSELPNDVDSHQNKETLIKSDHSENNLREDKNDFNDVQDVNNKDLNVCEPIYTLEGLYETLKKPPMWVQNTIPLKEGGKCVILNEKDDCHVLEDKFEAKERINRDETPKVLICHDMMGGYLHDKYINGVNEGNGFTFHRWATTDIFCYFSHHFITIPTLPWINVAHRFGTAVIGTIITEFTRGKALCDQFLKSEATYKQFADALVEICILFKFEGWLLNIENPVDDPKLLLSFVKYLTDKLHVKIPKGYVIWYDSVTTEGNLEWQNELNPKNKSYFDVCDGIYLNYAWDELKIKKSREMALNRNFNVYVGIDIWGRGSYGGGSFNAYQAAKVINNHKMSMAIFAHGWVHENNPKQPESDFLKRYYSRSSLLWKLFWPYMYTRPIQEPFLTFFRTGVTTDHYNLELQDVQPSFFPSHALTKETIHVDVAKDVCRCIEERLIDEHRCLLVMDNDLKDRVVVHRLFALDIEIKGKVRIDAYTDAYKDSNLDYEVVVLLRDAKNRDEKVVCSSKMMLNLSHPRNWEHRFILDYPGCKLMEIGVKLISGNYLNIYGFGVALE